MNGRSVLAALWRRRVVALVVLVVELAALAAWLVASPKSYTATATITATPQSQLLASAGNFDNIEQTLAALVNSRPVLADVVGRLHPPRSIDTLRDEVSGQQVTGTVLIRITVTDSDPHLAASIANGVADDLPLHDPSSGLFLFSDAGRATPPSGFSSPDLTVALLAGIALGIVLAIAAALVRESVVGTVDTGDQLAQVVGAPVLGRISRPADPMAVSVLNGNKAATSEFRALRVALEFASSEEPARTVVLASATPDRTDAWLAVNLATALAQVRYRVLLVDADFAEHARHPALDLSKRPGLTEVLRGAVPIREALVPGPVEGLSVLPVGAANGNSPASLVELRFHSFMAQLGDDFDIVLVLAAPLVESDDARIMAVGGRLLVSVPSGRVRSKELRRLVDGLEQVRVPLLGAVLMGARRRGD